MKRISKKKVLSMLGIDNPVHPAEEWELTNELAIAQAQLDADREEVQGAIDNILTEAVKEASNIKKLEYFLVDKLIALKQNI